MSKCIDCGYCGVKDIGTQRGVSAWDRLTEKQREYFYEVAKKEIMLSHSLTK